MFIVLTEDSTLGKDFFEKLFKALDIEATVLSSNGISNMMSEIDNIILSMNKESDLLYISLDNINGLEYDGNNRVKSSSVSVEGTWAYKIRQKCLVRYSDYHICLSTYYCIEEVFLSYTELPNLISKKYKDILMKIQKFIYEQRDYYSKVVNEFGAVLGIQGLKNQEKLCKTVFDIVTRKTLFKPCYNKNTGEVEMGKCWMEPCCISTNIYEAKKCPRFEANLMTAKDKAESIFKETLLCNCLLLEDIISYSKRKIDNTNEVEEVNGFISF